MPYLNRLDKPQLRKQVKTNSKIEQQNLIISKTLCQFFLKKELINKSK